MRKIFLTVNTDTADLRYNSSAQDVITNPADAPQIYSGEEVIFCVSFIGADLQPVTFADTDIFDFGIDTNFDHADNLMAYTDQINQTGDWSEADVTAGKISFRINTATTATAEKLAALADLQVKLEIRQFVSGSTLPSVLCQAPAVMHNTVIGVAPSAPDAEAYLTAAQVTAITDALAEDVTAAQTTAATAQSTADEAVTAAATAQSTADEAKTNAATAQSTADEAKTNAATAQSTADAAKTNAAAAQSTADEAVTAAATAQSTADEAVTAAATAQSTADEAKTNAATAQSTADEAVTAAATAQSTADEAVTAAATAQSTADEAKTNAATAQSTADSKITAPTTTGTAGQVLTLDSDAVTPVWADPSGGGGGGGGLTKWGEWKVFSQDTEYTAGTNGWIQTYANDGMDCRLIIDGKDISVLSFDNEGGYALLPFYKIITPVFAGQTYKVTNCMAPMFAPCV